MPQSRNKYSRKAVRARYRKPRQRRGGSLGWTVAFIVVVIAGIVGVVLVVQQNQSLGNIRPLAANQATGQPGDHWHTYLGVNVCGEWLGAAPSFEPAYDNQGGPNAGIHSHGDGLIHTHPFVSSEEGNHATLGHFLDNGGWSMSEDTIDIHSGYGWSGPSSAPNQRIWHDGDKCTFGKYKGKTGEVRWAVDGKEMTGDPSDYKLVNGATIAAYFVPKGADLEFPPNACTAFENITDQNAAAILTPNSPCSAPETTTVPASP